MTTSVVVDFHHEPEFPKLDNGERPRIELIREQVASYVEGYTVAKGHKPARIVLQAQDLMHCRSPTATRQRPSGRSVAKPGRKSAGGTPSPGPSRWTA
ncbi:TPA: hypothetical protein UM344_001257 [Stenotrophomonas maltophilia]|uniref:hypothetical protein n=1 Tax=Stenotrophomonas sp. SMYL28 TaxID=3076049 RepID=UPI001310AD90|nr:hypothetical protein [Stenotrophomonas sp. SMYL28]HEL3246042.1 hypothetical protein [Stenotrophomonas maltophilia]HEL4248015.1 hypothetical protein [Stenotrophomonas maltophilia]HEL4251631.1 hypothetical protein [Stenotrophomonas maltophilia]HEL7612353.1 hypothetical protein [Stenotrophomonas maltophilia]HEL7760389.1 hypothetical protein [Stenotrophomonas maltophilia]